MDPNNVNDGHSLACRLNHGKVIPDALRPEDIRRVESAPEREHFIRIEGERCRGPRAIGDGPVAAIIIYGIVAAAVRKDVHRVKILQANLRGRDGDIVEWSLSSNGRAQSARRRVQL